MCDCSVTKRRRRRLSDLIGITVYMYVPAQVKIFFYGLANLVLWHRYTHTTGQTDIMLRWSGSEARIMPKSILLKANNTAKHHWQREVNAKQYARHHIYS